MHYIGQVDEFPNEGVRSCSREPESLFNLVPLCMRVAQGLPLRITIANSRSKMYFLKKTRMPLVYLTTSLC